MKTLTNPAITIVLVCLLLGSGCSSIGYYAQSMSGQMHILFGKESVSGLIKDPDTDPSLRQKLTETREILSYAHQTLSLPDNGSYQHYLDLKRRYVVWNVVAAPELSLTAKKWCYPIVGCMNYRGYFEEEKAINYANSLREDGWEVYIGGVSAYSTLGWFRDPLINTMLNREDWEIARLLFHELAHQLVYVKDDTDFNEAFAESVSRIGLQSWLQSQPLSRQREVMEYLRHEDEFTRLALETRDSLEKIYASGSTESDKREEKATIISSMKDRLRQLQRGWDKDDRYQDWIDNRVDNARLSLISTYRALVPEFIHIYQESGSDMKVFYKVISELSECSQSERLARLLEQTAASRACP